MSAQASIQSVLFPKGNRPGLWAIVDPARDQRIYWALENSFLNYACLYAGQLAPELERVAPHLVELDPDDKFMALLEQHRGESWGVFLSADIGLAELRRHLRTFLSVRDYSGRKLVFRYYDPRVLSVYLPTCQDNELKTVFGPIRSFWAEETSSGELLQFDFNGNSLQRKRLALGPPAAGAKAKQAATTAPIVAGLPEIRPASVELLLAAEGDARRTPITFYSPQGYGKRPSTLTQTGAAIRLYKTFAGGEQIVSEDLPIQIEIPANFDGLTLYAESASAGEVTLTVTLEGGLQAQAQLRVFSVTIQHSQPRGIFLPLAYGHVPERYPISIERPAGLSDGTKLRLAATGGDLRAFLGADPVQYPDNVLNPDYEFGVPAAGTQLWLEGHQLSESVGDISLQLYLSGYTQAGASTPVTIYRQRPLEVNVPLQPSPTEPAYTTVAKDFEEPLVFVAGSISSDRPILLTVTLEPTGVPIGWTISRNPGDSEEVLSLSAAALPKLEQRDSGIGISANASGSFVLRSAPGFSQGDEIPDGVPGDSLSLIFVHVQLISDDSVVNTRFAACGRDADSDSYRLQSSSQASASAVQLQARLRLIGGGPEGMEGIDAICGGWTNNIQSHSAGAGYKKAGEVKLSIQPPYSFENGPLLDAVPGSKNAPPFLAAGNRWVVDSESKEISATAAFSPSYQWPIRHPSVSGSTVDHVWAYLECRSVLCICSRQFLFTPAFLSEYGWSFTADYAVTATKPGAALVKARVAAVTSSPASDLAPAGSRIFSIRPPLAAEVTAYLSSDGTPWPLAVETNK